MPAFWYYEYVDILFFLSAFFSEVIGTVAGFGSSTVFLPLALLFFDFQSALVLVALFHIFGNINRINFFRHGLDMRILIIFGVPSVILTFFGALLVTYISQDMLKVLLGTFLILYSLVSFWKDNLKVKPSIINSVVGGGLSGFLAGLIGTGGALRGAFLTAFGLPKEKYVATAAAIGVAVDVTRIPVYISQGLMEHRYYVYIPFLFVIALVASYTGKQIVRQVSQKSFKKIVFVALLVIGIKFVNDFFM